MGILLALYTGLRIGEVCGLKWEDFNEADSSISVRRTVQRITDNAGSTEFIVDTPKTKASRRTIPLPDFLCKLMAKMKKNDNCPIVSEAKAYKEPSQMRIYFYKLLHTLSIPALRFHDLRHTFATECIQLKFDTKTLSEILGHTNVSMTLNRYVHSSIEIKRKHMKLIKI